MQLGEYNGNQMQGNEDREAVKCNLMDLDKRAAEGANGLIGGLVDQVRRAWLNHCGIDAGCGNPLGKPVTKRRPVEICSGNDETCGQLNNEEKEEKGNPYSGEGVMPDVLLWFPGDK